MNNNWWIYDERDKLTLMVNDYDISTFKSRKDAELFAKEFDIEMQSRNCVKKEWLTTFEKIEGVNR